MGGPGFGSIVCSVQAVTDVADVAWGQVAVALFLAAACPMVALRVLAALTELAPALCSAMLEKKWEGMIQQSLDLAAAGLRAYCSREGEGGCARQEPLQRTESRDRGPETQAPRTLCDCNPKQSFAAIEITTPD